MPFELARGKVRVATFVPDAYARASCADEIVVDVVRFRTTKSVFASDADTFSLNVKLAECPAR